jgi:hypothetical protein
LRFLLRQHCNRDVALLGLPNGFSAWMLLFRECMDDYMDVGVRADGWAKVEQCRTPGAPR